MDNQEITHTDEGGKESFKFTQRGYMWLNPETLKWSYCNPAFSLRSLADIKRIVELEALVEEMEDRIINELRLMSPALKKPKEGQGFFIMKEDGQWEPKL
jgi:hypothetical protein